MSYSGVPNILIPLVISVFIVLNTMISSVYERRGEIGIYTSVGLAPSHVSFLFIAEALAFAVLSVVLGYLVAQTAAKLFADTALWAGITVNYSSLGSSLGVSHTTIRNYIDLLKSTFMVEIVQPLHFLLYGYNQLFFDLFGTHSRPGHENIGEIEGYLRELLTR